MRTKGIKQSQSYKEKEPHPNKGRKNKGEVEPVKERDVPEGISTVKKKRHW